MTKLSLFRSPYSFLWAVFTLTSPISGLFPDSGLLALGPSISLPGQEDQTSQKEPFQNPSVPYTITLL